jgi:hypothetical protein
VLCRQQASKGTLPLHPLSRMWTFTSSHLWSMQVGTSSNMEWGLPVAVFSQLLLLPLVDCSFPNLQCIAQQSSLLSLIAAHNRRRTTTLKGLHTQRTKTPLRRQAAASSALPHCIYHFSITNYCFTCKETQYMLCCLQASCMSWMGGVLGPLHMDPRAASHC